MNVKVMVVVILILLVVGKEKKSSKEVLSNIQQKQFFHVNNVKTSQVQ